MLDIMVLSLMTNHWNYVERKFADVKHLNTGYKNNVGWKNCIEIQRKIPVGELYYRAIIRYSRK